MNIEYLRENGIDFDNGLRRFVGKQGIYIKMLKKFLEDTNLEKAKEQFEQKNYEEAKRRIHALKGVSGNLSLTEMYCTCIECIDELKSENYGQAEILLKKLFEIEKGLFSVIADIEGGGQ